MTQTEICNEAIRMMSGSDHYYDAARYKYTVEHRPRRKHVDSRVVEPKRLNAGRA